MLGRHLSGILTRYYAEDLMYQNLIHSKISFVSHTCSLQCCLLSSTLVGLAVPTRKSKSFMDKAAKLNFVSATQPAVEQPLPVGYIPTPSSEVHSATEQEDDNCNATVEADSKENDGETEKQVCKKIKFVIKKRIKKGAPCEDRTHDLEIMRLTRCLLR